MHQASTGSNDTTIATTAFVKNQAYATLAGPAFTGVATAPTPTTSSNDTTLSTTAFVKNQSYVTNSTLQTYLFQPDRFMIGMGTFAQTITNGSSATTFKYPRLTDTYVVYINNPVNFSGLVSGGGTYNNWSRSTSVLLEIYYELIGAYPHSTNPSSATINIVESNTDANTGVYTNCNNYWNGVYRISTNLSSSTTPIIRQQSGYIVTSYQGSVNLFNSCNYVQNQCASAVSVYSAPIQVAFNPITAYYDTTANRLRLTIAFPNVTPTSGGNTLNGSPKLKCQ